MKKKLTAGDVAKFACPPGQQSAFIWDTEAKGLGIKASPGGTKQFILESRLHGKTLRLTIGDTKTWPLDGTAGNSLTARAEARRIHSLIDQGIDPRQVAAGQKAQAESEVAERKRKNITVSEAWKVYIEDRRPNWSERHLTDHEKLAHLGGKTVAGRNRKSDPGVLAALMPLKLSAITKEQVKAWLQDEAKKRPTQAALAYRLLRAFLNWCEDTADYKGIAAENACQARIAKDSLPRMVAKSDCLQREQLPAWFGAVQQIDNATVSGYLQILLLTGARREELASLRWDDVDFRWNKLTIHDKVEGERTIPLTPYVHSLLSNLKRINDTPPPEHRILRGKKIKNDVENWKPSAWAFSSQTARSGRLQDPSIGHRRACVSAGLDGLTLHGLRRSFGTLAEWVECPVGVSAQIMGHKPSAIAEKHYKVRPLDLLRMWHCRIEVWILNEAGIEMPKSVAAPVSLAEQA
jgi:integrase